jgi:hypothetical protein
MKYFFSAAILCCLICSSVAQNLTVGARIGGNMSQNSGDVSSDQNQIWTGAWLGGLQSDYWFDRIWTLSGQILFVETGNNISYYRFTSSGSPLSVTGNDYYSYIEIPVHIKWHLIVEPGFRPYIFTGVGLDYLLSASTRLQTRGYSGTGGYINQTQTFDDKEGAHSILVGAMAGVGIDYVFNSDNVFFGDIGYRFWTSRRDTQVDDGITEVRVCLGMMFILR